MGKTTATGRREVGSCGNDITIVIPCLNEAQAIVDCVRTAAATAAVNHWDAEILIIDNGSTDGSVEKIEKSISQNVQSSLSINNRSITIRLIKEPRRGYGYACLRGFKEAQGKYIFIADGDGSYDFGQMPLFIEKLKHGNDMVIGDRFNAGMKNGSMPWHHRYIGNPILSAFVRRFFKVKNHDVHCGARALSREAFNKMDLHCGGMEFASEMVVQAARRGLKMDEVPVDYRLRLGDSKLRSMRDGWRHLRFILLYSPLYLFFIPGIFLFGIGMITMTVLYFISPTILGIQLFVHPMFLSAAFIILGYELIFFSFFAKIYAVTHLNERSAVVERLFRWVTLERAGLAGIMIAASGLLVYAYIFKAWATSGFGSLDQIKNSIVALTLLVVGTQTVFSAFMLSIVGISGKRQFECQN